MLLEASRPLSCGVAGRKDEKRLVNHQYRNLSCHFLGIGSNLRPNESFPKIVDELLRLGPRLAVSRVIETEPVGLPSENQFLNGAAALWADLSPEQLKKACVAIEEKLGRDRTDPRRKFRDRPADIDILFSLDPSNPSVPWASLPKQSYIRLPLLELLFHLGLVPAEVVPELPPGVPLRVGGILLGEAPTTIHRDDRTGDVVVVEHRP